MSTAGAPRTTGAAGTRVAGGGAAAELLDRLVDDAAVFPPGNAALADAVPAHLAYRDASIADLVGPFLCPASRLADLPAALLPGAVLDVRVIVDTGNEGLADAVAAVTRDDRDGPYLFHGVEVALHADADLGAAARRLALAVRAANLAPQDAVFVEVPRGPSALAALDVLAEHGLFAKLRTGGADAAAFPTSAGVAAFVNACLDREIPFKCTAGLHNALRHSDSATGFEHHGFLNLLIATHLLVAGGSTADAVEVLESRDGSNLADSARALSPAEASRVRRSFRSYGSCSVTDPAADLAALGLLPRA